MKTVNKLQNHIHNYNYLYAAMHGGSGFALRNCWVAMALTPYTQLMHGSASSLVERTSWYVTFDSVHVSVAVRRKAPPSTARCRQLH